MTIYMSTYNDDAWLKIGLIPGSLPMSSLSWKVPHVSRKGRQAFLAVRLGNVHVDNRSGAETKIRIAPTKASYQLVKETHWPRTGQKSSSSRISVRRQ